MFGLYIFVFILYTNVNIYLAATRCVKNSNCLLGEKCDMVYSKCIPVGECLIEGSRCEDQNAVCKTFHHINKNRCVCRPGFVLSKGFFGIVLCFVGECSKLSKCKDLNAHCFNGKCLCNSGFLRYNGFGITKGSCKRGECLKFQYPCFDNNAQCVYRNNKHQCKCNDGFIAINSAGRRLKCHSGDCSVLTAPCNDKNAVCILKNRRYSCQCTGAYSYSGGQGRNVVCDTTTVSNNIVPCKYEIIDGTCKCRKDFVKISGTGNNILCQRGVCFGLEVLCEDMNADCILHEEKYKCQCREGYIQSSGSGGTIVCFLGQCLQHVAPCLSNAQCIPFGPQIGTRCVCKRGFISKGGDGVSLVCDRDIGCTADVDCKNVGEICDETTSTCQIGFKTDAQCKEHNFCHAAIARCRKKNIGCTADVDCKTVGEICDETTSTCQIGCRTDAQCKEHNFCHAATARCRKKSCLEMIGWYYFEENRYDRWFCIKIENEMLKRYTYSGSREVNIIDKATCIGTLDDRLPFSFNISTLTLSILSGVPLSRSPFVERICCLGEIQGSYYKYRDRQDVAFVIRIEKGRLMKLHRHGYDIDELYNLTITNETECSGYATGFEGAHKYGQFTYDVSTLTLKYFIGTPTGTYTYFDYVLTFYRELLCGPFRPACNSYQFTCANGECIDIVDQCNGGKNCYDGSDEYQGCACNSYQFTCTSGQCIPLYDQCNSRDDCDDGSDEYQGCACNSYQFTCTSGQCISLFDQCDSRDHCDDGSDEYQGCVCNSIQFTCVSDNVCIEATKQCDYSRDCEDGSDEVGCDLIYSQSLCHPPNFRCTDNGKCIELKNVCNGFYNCDNGSDEVECG